MDLFTVYDHPINVLIWSHSSSAIVDVLCFSLEIVMI